MTISKPLAKRRALRALAEGAKPTLDLLADASGRSLRLLKLEAERDGWQLDETPLVDLEARLGVLGAALLDQIEAAVRRAKEEGKLDKTEIDAMTALARSIEKVGEIMRPLVVAKEKKNDEELAEVLGQINDRIIELAQEFAAQIIEERDRAAGRVSGEGGVVEIHASRAVPAGGRA